MKNTKGITLIALVVTIIVLIILAAISINLLLGDNGIIKKSREASIAQEKADIVDRIVLDIAAKQVERKGDITNSDLEEVLEKYGEVQKTGDEITGIQPENKDYIISLAEIYTGRTVEGTTPQNSNTVIPGELQSDDMLTKTTNSTYTDTSYTETNNVVTIPAGYKVSTDSAEKIEDGIVIEDANGNQWVWIPVNEDMADEITATELGGIGKSGVTTTLKSKSELLSGKERENIGEEDGYREPDILIGGYDKTENAGTLLLQAGFTNTSTALTDFATDLSISYKNMIESVKEYGGFYVGRYEITGTLENPTEKSGWAITGTSSTTSNNVGGEQEANWYKLYNTCTKFTTSSATSRMIWGCTWDEICKFIANKGYTDANAEKFGNYYDNIVKSSDGTQNLTTSNNGTKLQTGITTFTKTCNIYDLAGNCWEYTQEACGVRARICRGRFL